MPLAYRRVVRGRLAARKARAFQEAEKPVLWKGGQVSKPTAVAHREEAACLERQQAPAGRQTQDSRQGAVIILESVSNVRAG